MKGAKKRKPSVISKLANARLLAQHGTIRKSVPPILLLTQSNLCRMVEKYSTVYVKPNDSCQGKGIIRIDRLQNGSFLIRTRDYQQQTRCKGKRNMWLKVQRFLRKRLYVVQKGIHSVTRGGIPYDIRIHVLRVKGRWQVGGMVGRLAKKNQILTNRHSGGMAIALDDLLAQGLGLNQIARDQLKRNLAKVGLIAANVISRVHPKWAEFGVDVGIDPRGRIWIYEVNITPGFMNFRDVDKRSFQRIISLRKIAK